MNSTHDLITSLIRKHTIAVNELTEQQFAEAIRQALPDFIRFVHADNQQVVYLPGRDAEKWKRLYHELIMEVASKYPNETRHETALRYIREAEHKTRPPAMIQ